jgi:outer membrane protein TolC
VLTGEVPSAFPAEVAVHDAAAPRRVIPVGDGAALLRRRPDVRQAERSWPAPPRASASPPPSCTRTSRWALSAGGVGFMDQFGANTWKLARPADLVEPAGDQLGARAHRPAEGRHRRRAGALRRVVLNALRETESALTVYARELDRNAMLRAARDQSALASRQTGKLYQFGRTDFLAALDADRTLASAESLLAASDAQLAADQVQLFLALGGGWG